MVEKRPYQERIRREIQARVKKRGEKIALARRLRVSRHLVYNTCQGKQRVNPVFIRWLDTTR